MIRVGIVGLGGMGMTRRKILSARPDVRITAVSDMRAEVVEQARQELGCWGGTSFAELCGRDDVDAVVISVPNKFHFPVALEALRRGKHTFVEYPLAVSLSEVDQLGRQARESGVKCQCGMSMLFEPAHRLIKRDVDRLGKVVGSVYMIEFGNIYKWAYDDGIMGDFFALSNYHLTAHQIDLFGPARWVNATLYYEKDGQGRNQRIFGSQHLGFDHGVTGYNHFGMTVTGRHYWTAYLLGSQGCLWWEARGGMELQLMEPGAKQRETIKRTPEEIGKDDSKEKDMGDFMEAIQQGRDTLFRPEFVRHSLEVSFLSTRSAREGRRIEVPPPAVKVQL